MVEYNVKNFDYKLFEKLVSMKQKSLRESMKIFLKKYYPNVYCTKQYIFAVGDIPIGLVAHMDTVFAMTPDNVYYDREKNVIWSPEGLGADDRAGVLGIIQIIKSGLRPHIILTTDEEVGGVGATALITSFPQLPVDIKYLIQLDRQGTDDCVFYNCDNYKFINYVQDFGFKERFGSFSDIYIICPVWGVAGVNLSIGYRDEHSIAETFHVNDYLSTIGKVINMLKSADEAEYFKYISFMNNYKEEQWINCASCGKMFAEIDTIPVKDKNGRYHFYCIDCVSDKVNWCHNCGEAFLSNSGKDFCESCESLAYGMY